MRRDRRLHSAAGALAAILFLADRCLANEVVPVVPAGSPVATLSRAQVADIFLGKTNRFPDGSVAVPIDLAEGSAARDEFYARFTGKSPAQVNAHWSKIVFTGRGRPPRVAASEAELKKQLAENPGAIGYLDSALVDRKLRVLPDH